MDEKNTDENYTTAGIRKGSYDLVKKISKAVGMKKIDVLSDLIDDMPGDYLLRFVEKRKKQAKKRRIREIKKLDASISKIIRKRRELKEEGKIIIK